MSGPGAGFEFKPKDVTWNKRDSLLFASSIGADIDELQFVFVSTKLRSYLFQADLDPGERPELPSLPDLRHRPSYRNSILIRKFRH